MWTWGWGWGDKGRDYRGVVHGGLACSVGRAVVNVEPRREAAAAARQAMKVYRGAPETLWGPRGAGEDGGEVTKDEKDEAGVAATWA